MVQQKIIITTDEDLNKEIAPLLKNRRKSIKNTPAFGMWAERTDMEDASSYVRESRKSRF